jgi:tryptophan synthase alpha chain
MEPIRATFERLRRSRHKALIPFIMGGEPHLRTTSQLLLALEDAGADLIEVGIPFSDPLADGPIIQAASARALARGATPAGVLRAIAAVHRRLRAPVVCLSYWNPVVQFGDHGRASSPTAFLRAARDAGVSGLIVPDLPVEEGATLQQAAVREGVASIFLAAPTSPPERLRAIARASRGFIYYVSVTGTTGVRRTLPPGLVQGVRQLKLLTTKPVCVGFGISTPAQAVAVARIADGVIVGSALLKAIEGTRGRRALESASAFVTRLRRAVSCHGRLR